MSEEKRAAEFDRLVELLRRIPGVKPTIGSGRFDNGAWWVKFQIDIGHPQAWNVVQWMGHALNYLALNDPLPTLLMPVSPPPYGNGGPEDCLSWVIESRDAEYSPDQCAEDLDGVFPYPIEKGSKWVEKSPTRRGLGGRLHRMRVRWGLLAGWVLSGRASRRSAGFNTLREREESRLLIR